MEPATADMFGAVFGARRGAERWLPGAERERILDAIHGHRRVVLWQAGRPRERYLAAQYLVILGCTAPSTHLMLAPDAVSRAELDTYLARWSHPCAVIDLHAPANHCVLTVEKPDCGQANVRWDAPGRSPYALLAAGSAFSVFAAAAR